MPDEDFSCTIDVENPTESLSDLKSKSRNFKMGGYLGTLVSLLIGAKAAHYLINAPTNSFAYHSSYILAFGSLIIFPYSLHYIRSAYKMSRQISKLEEKLLKVESREQQHD